MSTTVKKPKTKSGATAKPVKKTAIKPKKTEDIAQVETNINHETSNADITLQTYKKILVVVESPAKSKTIASYLGNGFTVMASKGHLRQIPSKPNAITFDNEFKFTWEVDDSKFNAIFAAAKKHDAILLASDRDREGEAISYHVSELLKPLNKPIKRIDFIEITKTAIDHALNNQRNIDMDLVNAYFTRVGLDYSIGFELSPVLRRKLRMSNLSAGRVQNPTIISVSDLEMERINFQPQTSYSLGLKLIEPKNQIIIGAKVIEYNKKELDEQLDDKNMVETLYNELPESFVIKSVTSKKINLKPAAPFITSSLQQEASNKLGLKIKEVMRIAQELYEGMDIDGKSMGLITYMRTDSINMSDDAVSAIRDYVKTHYKNQLPEKPNLYKTKVKNAQEAHECIRPTTVSLDPQTLQNKIPQLHLDVYKLIWNKAVASQMTNAIREQFTSLLESGSFILKTTDSHIIEPGYMVLSNKDQKIATPLVVGDVFNVHQKEVVTHVTEPPSHYVESTLVKKMETDGYGRPSTYASIIETLFKREYTTLKSKAIIPSFKGHIVGRFIKHYFTKYSSAEFTAYIEEFLDEIASGKRDFSPLLQELLLELQNIVKLTMEIPTSEIMKSIGAPLLHDLKYICDVCASPLDLGMKFSFFGFCTGCGKTVSLSHVETIEEDIKLVRNEKYTYLTNGERKIYLPKNFKYELTPAVMEIILSLPKTVATIDGEPVTAGVNNFGFFLKYNNKYKSVYDINKLLNMEQSWYEYLFKGKPKVTEES